MTWTLFLLFLLTAQLQEGDAVTSLKLKKILKKALLLRALSPKKSVAVIPIPIPLSLIKDILDKLTMPKMDMPMMMEMPKMPPPMYPSYMPAPMMMMPKSDGMPPKKEEMMPSSYY
ncbi:uncharacterized protein [Parasteatoda tepidariorum]|uniref:uncharacterized protein n=1 Tax=Parasteatoda tepidariorum TaxID=114398 RepID=UPI0039BCBB46